MLNIQEPLQSWSTAKVVQWLSANNFSQYANEFSQQGIDGESLMILIQTRNQSADFANLVTQLGDRLKMAARIEKIIESQKNQPSTPLPPLSVVSPLPPPLPANPQPAFYPFGMPFQSNPFQLPSVSGMFQMMPPFFAPPPTANLVPPAAPRPPSPHPPSPPPISNNDSPWLVDPPPKSGDDDDPHEETPEWAEDQSEPYTLENALTLEEIERLVEPKHIRPVAVPPLPEAPLVAQRSIIPALPTQSSQSPSPTTAPTTAAPVPAPAPVVPVAPAPVATAPAPVAPVPAPVAPVPAPVAPVPAPVAPVPAPVAPAPAIPVPAPAVPVSVVPSPAVPVAPAPTSQPPAVSPERSQGRVVLAMGDLIFVQVSRPAETRVRGKGNSSALVDTRYYPPCDPGGAIYIFHNLAHIPLLVASLVEFSLEVAPRLLVVQPTPERNTRVFARWIHDLTITEHRNSDQQLVFPPRVAYQGYLYRILDVSRWVREFNTGIEAYYSTRDPEAPSFVGDVVTFQGRWKTDRQQVWQPRAEEVHTTERRGGRQDYGTLIAYNLDTKEGFVQSMTNRALVLRCRPHLDAAAGATFEQQTLPDVFISRPLLERLLSHQVVLSYVEEHQPLRYVTTAIASGHANPWDGRPWCSRLQLVSRSEVTPTKLQQTQAAFAPSDATDRFYDGLEPPNNSHSQAPSRPVKKEPTIHQAPVVHQGPVVNRPISAAVSYAALAKKAK
ncbi:hypothetical protein PAPYR_1500 [Paratrimastix pyriformis]|uniref:SAM domain-containing protein n=1 Tax=Paratrimastix pyriformis TaxID=342808 RepID=A0ABQ8USM0_9EUKA|nr:hypothetical protein PAPYR_1500 [Paratrimastix pyriformis]